MAKKKQSASSIEIERLEKESRKINKKLREARDAENEKRTLGAYRDYTKEAAEKHNEIVKRHQGYDTNDKARVFGYGAFTHRDGSLKWVRTEAIYAVEVEAPSVESGIKATTWLKTVDGAVDVSQTADEVFNELDAVRFAYSKEQVNEMLAEQTRRENKIAERKQKAKEKAAKAAAAAPAPAGPNFQAVSDAVGFDPTDEDDLDDDDRPDTEGEGWNQ